MWIYIKKEGTLEKEKIKIKQDPLVFLILIDLK